MIASWHLTWQDPVAIGLAVAGLLFAWWLRRRLDRPARAHRVPTSELSIGRRGEPEDSER